MRCKKCNYFLTRDEIRLLKDECFVCVDEVKEDPLNFDFATVPKDISSVDTQEVLEVFKDKGSLSHKDINVGSSDYAKHNIQPWDIWREYDLNPWEGDIIKRILRTKRIPGYTEQESRLEDFKKIRHICDEMIAQLEGAYDD